MKPLFNIWICVALGLVVYSCKPARPTIPVFDVKLTDSVTVFNTGSIPEGKPAVIVFFSSDCKHCQDETRTFIKNIDSIRNINFYYVSIEPYKDVKLFHDYFKMDQYPNFTITWDYSYAFLKYFKPSSTPYILVYDKEKGLRYKFAGEVEFRAIMDSIRKIQI